MSPAEGHAVRLVGHDEAMTLVREGALLLDVREPEEWATGHIAGARHVPLRRLDPATLPAGSRVVAVCRSGNRSGVAAALLVAAGHDAVNLDGGMTAWTEAGRPVVVDAS